MRSKNQALIMYFILAYAFSWGIQIPLALQSQGVIQESIPYSLHYLSAYGPMLSAILVTWTYGGSAGLKELFGRIFKWRIRPYWWLIALAPLILLGLLAVASWLYQGQWMDISLMGDIDFLPDIGLGAMFLWILTFGIGEETGWRGFALPRLQKNHSALTATIILWLFWALWHLPLFFYSYDISILVGFLLGLLAGAITFTWLYNSTQGSILAVAIFHGVYNFTTGCSLCKTGLISAIISSFVMVWAVLVVVIFKPANLSHVEKQVTETKVRISNSNLHTAKHTAS